MECEVVVQWWSVDKRDRVIELKDVPQSSVGAPLPVVLSDEFKILLAYIAEESSPGWDGSHSTRGRWQACCR